MDPAPIYRLTYHYKARAYSPAFGRFMQTDPIGYEAGMNLYAYVENDPVNFTDPSGLQPYASDYILVTAPPSSYLPVNTGSFDFTNYYGGNFTNDYSAPADEIVVTGTRIRRSNFRCGIQE